MRPPGPSGRVRSQPHGPAPRSSRPRRRPSPAVLRRRRLGILALALGISGALGGSAPARGVGTPSQSRALRRPVDGTLPSLQVTSALADWQLPAPLSRMSVVPLSPGAFLLAGGLDPQGRSSANLLLVDPARGTVTTVGQLPEATHDAGAARLRSEVLVFGGGQISSTALVQGVPLRNGRIAPPAQLVGALPAPRSDGVALGDGPRAVVVGGWDGASGDGAVVSTSDGSRFPVVADLPVPVRYPAVALLGQTLWVLGGLATSGPAAGQPVATVQTVDLTSGRTQELSPLPEVVTGAGACTVDGQILLLGGRTTGAPNPTVWTLRPLPGAAGQPLGVRIRPVGELTQAVAHAGVLCSGPTIWVLGGELDGRPLASVQVLHLHRA
jgi:hypothetical protein